MAIPVALLGFHDLGRSVIPIFLFENRFYLQLSTHCPKMNKKSMWQGKINSPFLSTGHWSLPSCGCKARGTVVAKWRAYKWKLSGSARQSEIGILCFDWLIHPGVSYSLEIWIFSEREGSYVNEWMCIYIPHISHIVSRQFTILIEWDRTSACKGASGCRYRFIFDLTHPPNPCMKCTMKLQIDHHTGNYVPYSFRQACGFFNVPCWPCNTEDAGDGAYGL